jgi:hypothetical protein
MYQYKNKFKIVTKIPVNLRDTLTNYALNAKGYEHLSPFLLTIAEDIYKSTDNYLAFIPDQHSLYNSFSSMSELPLKTFVFYFPNTIHSKFHKISTSYHRKAKREAEFFLYCLYTNIKNFNSIYNKNII